MKEQDISWAEFKKWVDSDEANPWSTTAFRGQGNDSWKVTSTLQRVLTDKSKLIRLDNYREFIQILANESQLFLNREISIPSFAEGIKIELYENPQWKGEKHVYRIQDNLAEFLIYLRHMGVPSPLVDISNSPYVAAFFAFNNPDPNTEKVSIFCQNYPYPSSHDEKGFGIQVLKGNNTRIHNNHLIQQGAYLITYQVNNADAFISNEPFDFYFSHKFKFDLKERDVVLRDLNRMNINEFTLLNTFKETFTYKTFRKFVL